MRGLLLLGLLCLSGCQSMRMPFQGLRERADDPLLTPYEQERKVRYLHAFPDEELAPRSGIERPGPFGR